MFGTHQPSESPMHECGFTSFSIFDLPPTCRDIQYTVYEKVEPNSPNIERNDSLNLDFVYKGANYHYIDLSNSYLYLKCSILHADNTPLAHTEKIGPINNFGEYNIYLFSNV